MKEKIVIITGAAQGIGKAIGEEYAKLDATVILTDIDSKVKEVANDIKEDGKFAEAFICDVSDRKAVQEMVEKILVKHHRIDVLVNNAGIYPSKAFSELDKDLWDKTLNINLSGIFYLVQAVLPQMKKQGEGKIVNIASIAGTRLGYPQLVHYSTTKAGVLGFTRALAVELAQENIQVNAIAPGAIYTPGAAENEEQVEQMKQVIPMKRWGKPEEIAHATIFLSSEMASYITGELLVVDGGWTIQ